ncbi:hypothetical protein BDA99DRAFT_538616 [Phascolomyces articulosus]|uniref:F-box domain-containing protein n=1 Tax=Phascolomyces articulosus TaxID=60185 RepID=A0AAD5JYA5_9FUNG|nr:hypothetical protein BDA99DRAFT_538616 [Phascolomyces articulosus]
MMVANDIYLRNNSDNDDQTMMSKSGTNLTRSIETKQYDSGASAIVDFFTKLPSEILSSTLTLLSLEDLTTIKSVSRQYRNRVIACPEVWTTIVLSQRSLKDYEPHLPNIELHVVNLKLYGLSSEQYQNIFSRIHKGHFKKLRVIDIKGYDLFNGKEDDVVMDQFISALYQIKETITELSVYIATTTMDQQQSTIPLEDIIDKCINLSKFHYIQYNAVLKQPQFIAESTIPQQQGMTMDRPNLTDIKLDFKSIQQSTLDTIMMRCPNLQNMSFYGCNITNNIEFRNKLPSSMISFSRNGLYYTRPSTTINVTRNGMKDEDDIDSENQYSFPPTGPGYITSLNGSLGEFQDIEWVIDNDTLEKLETFGIMFRCSPPTDVINPVSDSCSLYSATFHKLRDLSLYYNNSSENDSFFIDLLRRTPNLNGLSIYDCDELSGGFINILRERSIHSLTSLYMDCVFEAEDQQGIERLFRDLAEISQQQKKQQMEGNNIQSAKGSNNSDAGGGGMKRAILLNCGFNMDKVMDAIAEMDTLEYLDMQCCEMSEGTMESFFEKLVKRQSNIEAITMTCQDGITDKVLQYMNMLPKLDSVSFWAQDEITKHGVQPLRDNPQFKKLVISECEQIQEE